MLACVPDLTFLRLYTITHHQIESISFPPLLQTLDFYTVDFKTVERIIELLATKPIWCPRLTRLVRFGSIGYSADLLRITQNERELRMQKFRDNCGQAFGARASSGFWRGDPFEFKRLANKPRAFGLSVVVQRPLLSSSAGTRIASFAQTGNVTSADFNSHFLREYWDS